MVDDSTKIEVANVAKELNLPTIRISWDQESQQVMIGFDPKEFKTWKFMKFCIDSAGSQVEEMEKQAHMAAMQKNMMEQQQALVVANSLNGKKLRT